MTRPDDAVFRVRVETCAVLRRVLPIVILAVALVGPLFVVDPSVSMWLSLGLFLVSLFVLWTVNGLALYPAHTFGIEYRFEDEPIDSERRRCVRCETSIEDGTHRRYARQLVVLGIPIHTLGWGSNDFCPDCLEAGPATEREQPADSSETEVHDSVTDPGSATVEGSNPMREESTSNHDPGTDTVRREGRYTKSSEDSGPGMDIVRRVDHHDETIALELEQAFEEDDIQ